MNEFFEAGKAHIESDPNVDPRDLDPQALLKKPGKKKGGRNRADGSGKHSVPVRVQKLQKEYEVLGESLREIFKSFPNFLQAAQPPAGVPTVEVDVRSKILDLLLGSQPELTTEYAREKHTQPAVPVAAITISSMPYGMAVTVRRVPGGETEVLARWQKDGKPCESRIARVLIDPDAVTEKAKLAVLEDFQVPDSTAKSAADWDGMRFEVRSITMEHPTWYGVWDTRRKMFLPNESYDGPFKFKDWAVASVACSLLNAAYPFPHPDFDGGETWMEDFEVFGTTDEEGVAMLTHKECSDQPGKEWSLESDNNDPMNLRQLLQAAYEHIEECGK